MGGDGIILVIGRFLLILVTTDDFQVIWPEMFAIDFLNAVDEFDWSGIAVFGKEGDRYVSCLDSL